MNTNEFNLQMGRLFSLFGEKSFSNERLKMIWNFTSDLSANSFERIIDHMISNFRQTPLPKDFKEAAVGERNNFADLRSVPAIMSPDFKGDRGLQMVLERDYPGTKTLWEAIEIERHRIRVRESEAAWEDEQAKKVEKESG